MDGYTSDGQSDLTKFAEYTSDGQSQACSNLQNIPACELIEELNNRYRNILQKEERVHQLEKRILAMNKDAEDVIEINAGGQIFAFRRDTMRLAADSVLAALFSGNWDESHPCDSNGRPFLEIDPYIFDKIINFLRQKRMEGPESHAPMPCIAQEKQEEYSRVIRYYCLEHVLALPSSCLENVPASPSSLKFLSLSPPSLSPSLPPIRACNHQICDAVTRGYQLHLNAPLKLRAVLVGVTSQVVVILGQENFETVQEIHTRNVGDCSWAAGRPELSQIAPDLNITLSPPTAYIMVKSNCVVSWSVVSASSDIRCIGAVSVASKSNWPHVQNNTCNIKMTIVYDETA